MSINELFELTYTLDGLTISLLTNRASRISWIEKRSTISVRGCLINIQLRRLASTRAMKSLTY